MGLQVQPTMFKWLQTHNLVKQGRRTPQNKIQIPEQIAIKFFDGVYICLIIKQIIKVRPDVGNSFEKLDAIKENSTPAIRLYNWNILCEVLKKLGLGVEYAEKSRLLNMEQAPLLKILQFLYKLQQNEQVSSPQQPKPLKVDLTELPKKTIKQSSNILQFFVISISKNFKLSPQHTLNLFLDNNKYLAHLLVKGVKNSYQPIYALFEDIIENIGFIVVTLFCTDQKESVTFFLGAVKPALISKEASVAEKCIEVLTELYDTYKTNSIALDIVNNWMKQQGLNTIFFSIKRHPQLFDQLITTIHTFLGRQLYPFIQPVQKSLLWQSESQKILFFSNLIAILPKQSLKQFIQNRTYAAWIKYLVKHMKKSKEPKEMSALLTVMAWLWENLEEEVEADQNGVVGAFMGFLKSCSLNPNEVVFNQSIVTMFHLMQTLGTHKNLNAPLLYKTLINCFTFCGIPQRISYLASNFKSAFQNIKNLPGGALVDPLLKNMEKEISLDCIILCRVMIDENRVSEDEFVEIVELLTSLVFHQVDFGGMAVEAISDNFGKMNEDMIADYLEKNMKNTLAHFYSTTASIKRKFGDLKSDFKRYAHDQSFKKGGNAFIQQMKKHTLLGNLINFYKVCANQSQQIKNSTQPLLFHTYIRIKNQLKKQDQAKLLLPLMKLSYNDQQQIQKQVKQYQQQLNPPKSIQNEQQSILNNKSSLNNRSSMNRSLSIGDQPSTPKPLDLTLLKPSSYAIKDLDKVKKKIEHLKTMEEKKKEEKDIIQEKKELFRSVLNQKRMVEFGVKSVQNMEYKCVFQWGTAREEDPSRMYGVPNIRLMNLANEEQTAFVQDVDSIIKKYRKVWRFLFFKYSSFGAKNKQQMKTQQKINMAQVWKMIKQYQVNIIKKQQSHAIVRMINQAMKRRNDLQNLTYLGFEEYIFQMCYYGYGKSGFGHLSPGQKIRMFLKQLKQITAQKGGNIDLFENPQEIYFQQTQVIRQFNKRLKQNPQYILPQGYKKVRHTQLFYDYQIHPVNIKGFSSTYNDVYQVLDQILSECPALGFHIIQPLTHKQQKSIAKPCLFQNISQKLKQKSKGYLNPKKSPPATAQKKQRQKKAVLFKNQFHPHINFSLGIKLGLAGVNIKNRFIADQVAYWMDDLLDSVEKGLMIVENKAKKKIDNEALKRKRASINKMKIQQKNQQQKWKKRAESVKAEVVQIKQKKKQTQKYLAEQRRAKKKIQKQKQQQQLKKKLQQFKAAKDKLQQKRKQQQNKKKQQNQKKKKQKQQYRKGVQEYFKKKKQQLQQKQVTMKKNKQDQQKKHQQQELKKKQQAKKLHMSILLKQQNVLQKVQVAKKGYDQAWKSKQIQNKFAQYQTPLKLLFDLLLKYQKSKISTTTNDELSLNTLQFFALKFKIVPFMMEKNNFAKMFKITSRSNQGSGGANFKVFKEVLFKVSVKSKELLNGIVQRKKEKEKEMQMFLSKKSSDGGNHFDVEENQMGVSKLQNSSSISPKKQSLTDQYLFDTQGVTAETVDQMLKFLNLPKDKLSMQQRFRQVLEQKNTKPKNILVKQLKSNLQ